MKKFTIFNPFSGQAIQSGIPANRLAEMVKYFAWLTGVQASTLVVMETA